MRRKAILVPLVLLAACRGGEEAPMPAPSGSEVADAAVAVSEAAPEARAFKQEISNDRYSFSYAYPAAAAAIPALKTQLDAEMDEARADIADMGKAGLREARADKREFNPYDRSISWTVVTELPGWLSLLGDAYEFSGGAHGNTNTTPLLWDKAAGRRRDPLSLFVSKEAFDGALGQAYCAALNKERAKRRETPVDPGSGDEFDKCLAPSEVTVLLGSSDKRHFNRIGLIADPYAAGPYVEGSYEVTLPVSDALLKAVKPEYRGAFTIGR